MRFGVQKPEPLKDGSPPDCHALGAVHHGDDIAALRPIRALLSRRDYWQLNEHRRRCEDLEGAGAKRLAHLLRAKMSDAIVADDCELNPDVVSGRSRVTFSLDGRRPETRMLYHWSYPEADRSRLHVGTFLGATLIGMTVGQRMPLLAGDGVGGKLQVLGVQTGGFACERSRDMSRRSCAAAVETSLLPAP